jgi:surface antigen
VYRRLKAKLGRKTMKRRITRASFVTFNIALLVGVVFFVLHARTSSATSSAVVASASPEQAALNPLDQVSSADIALTVSRMGGLNEATAIKNQSESDDAQLSSAPTTNNVVSKPQVVATAFKSKNDIQSYTAVAGDTATSIAAKFNVTSDSVRWSNGLTGDTVIPGTKLSIPPVGYSGIVYTVKAGDTVDSLAQKYQADKSQLIAANDAEITGLQVNEQIIIPNGQQPAPVVTYAASYQSTGFAWGGSAIYGYNGYDYGYCTWWVATRREQVGMPLPSNLGNASSWPRIGSLAGIAEGNTPKQYAAAVTSQSGEGHVVFVEAVNDDGSIVISEMNHVGWAVKDTETISADAASRYIYLY